MEAAGEAERTGRTGAQTAAAGLRQTTAGTLGTSGDAFRPTAGPAPPSDTPDTRPTIMGTEDHTIITTAPHITVIPGMGAAAAGIMEVIMEATPVTSVLGGSPRRTRPVLAS